MGLDEAWPVSAEYLLDTGAGRLHHRNHNLLVVCLRSPLIVLESVTTFKLSHLLKSIVTLTSATLGFSIRVLIPTASSWIILGDLWSIRLCIVCRVGLRWLLLTWHTSGPCIIHSLRSVVKPGLEHLPWLLRTVAPRLIFLHFTMWSGLFINTYNVAWLLARLQ